MRKCWQHYRFSRNIYVVADDRAPNQIAKKLFLWSARARKAIYQLYKLEQEKLTLTKIALKVMKIKIRTEKNWTETISTEKSNRVKVTKENLAQKCSWNFWKEIYSSFHTPPNNGYPLYSFCLNFFLAYFLDTIFSVIIFSHQFFSVQCLL